MVRTAVGRVNTNHTVAIGTQPKITRRILINAGHPNPVFGRFGATDTDMMESALRNIEAIEPTFGTNP